MRSEKWSDITSFPKICFGARTVDGKLCTGDTSIRNYTIKHIKTMSKRNNITCGCEKCTIAMLIQ